MTQVYSPGTPSTSASIAPTDIMHALEDNIGKPGEGSSNDCAESEEGEENEEDAEITTMKQLAMRREIEERRHQRKKLSILQQSNKRAPPSK